MPLAAAAEKSTKLLNVCYSLDPHVGVCIGQARKPGPAHSFDDPDGGLDMDIEFDTMQEQESDEDMCDTVHRHRTRRGPSKTTRISGTGTAPTSLVPPRSPTALLWTKQPSLSNLPEQRVR